MCIYIAFKLTHTHTHTHTHIYIYIYIYMHTKVNFNDTLISVLRKEIKRK